MQEPQQIDKLEKRVKQLENAISDWQDWKFITRDSSHKIGLAQDLTVSLQNEVLEMKVSLAHIARTVDDVLQRQIEMSERFDKYDERFDKLDKKIDLILGLLEPNKGNKEWNKE
jgi:soluble cytochrome b562